MRVSGSILLQTGPASATLLLLLMPAGANSALGANQEERGKI